jgi:hypothetical protein
MDLKTAESGLEAAILVLTLAGAFAILGRRR